MTLAAVRDELATKLRTIDPLSGRTRTFAPESVSPPSAFIGTMSYDPRAAFGGVANLTAEVWVVISRAADSVRAAETLDSYIDGVNAVPDALEATGTAWDSLAVTSIEFPITVEFNQTQFLAARFDCELYL